MAAISSLTTPEVFLATVLSAREGHRDAFDTLCRAYYPRLLGEAHKLVPRNLWAKIGPEDVVQETLLDAWRDFPQFHGSSPEELWAWLGTLLRHTAQNGIQRFRGRLKRDVAREIALEARGTREKIEESLSVLGPSPADEAMRDDEALALFHALERLPPKYWAVISIHWSWGFTFEWIASLFGWASPEAARMRYNRGIARLRQELCSGRLPPLHRLPFLSRLKTLQMALESGRRSALGGNEPGGVPVGSQPQVDRVRSGQAASDFHQAGFGCCGRVGSARASVPRLIQARDVGHHPGDRAQPCAANVQGHSGEPPVVVAALRVFVRRRALHCPRFCDTEGLSQAAPLSDCTDAGARLVARLARTRDPFRAGCFRKRFPARGPGWSLTSVTRCPKQLE